MIKRLLVAALLVVLVAAADRPDFAVGVEAYERGEYQKAFEAWLPLAREGDPAAQRNVGHMFRRGLGVPKNFKKAAEWYRRAAEQGLSRAQANLANMYLRGQGVAKDVKLAARWFRRAAEQGHAIAQYNLGLLYENGVGVERIFPMHSPRLAKVEIVSQGYVRQSRIYFLRDRIGKATKLRRID